MEARLAVSGSAALIDASCDFVLVFDIGGGSSELILLDLTRRNRQRDRRFAGRLDAQHCMVAWTSLPIGVVTLAERFGGRHVAPADFEAMVAETQQRLQAFEAQHKVVRAPRRPPHAYARHLRHRDHRRRHPARLDAL